MTEESLPERIFAVGEEPNGERVTSYQKAWQIKSIVTALDEEEIDFLRRSIFGKLIATAEKQSFSGRFGRFIITKQLNIKKKHELWILFAWRPIRFSLREFASVTGLPCGKFPKKTKKKTKNTIKETPYWLSLFGNLESVTVDCVTKMLKRKTLTDKDIRIKYACLAIVASVLLPTSHNPKIVKVHAEIIRDIDYYYLYPWGRLAFDMTMWSIESRDAIGIGASGEDT